MSRAYLDYTPQEDQFIIDNYGNMSAQKISDGIDRTCGAVISRARRLNVNSPRSKDLSGKKFGRLLVLERTDEIYKSNGNFMWKCLCDCGKIIKVQTSSLTSWNTKSCGCLKVESDKKSPGNMLDLREKRFGRLIALYSTKERVGSFVVWKCRCDCGNYHNVPTGYLTSGRTKSCGCLNIEKSIQNLPNDYKGEKHWNWKGGITPKERQARNTQKYRTWRTFVFNRDSYLCQKCTKSGYLHAHHVLSFDDYENLRYDIDNGITLCASCHRIFHIRYDNYNRDCLEEYLDE